ncbi:HamA C-terminal domain-containing protein [Ponticaulis profundi]|uniref:DUF1837 domain-containing protein n=1 Tax=Ponticaulis profundi TaxID=2665222 RepID=A0ABW1SCS6_9PROT
MELKEQFDLLLGDFEHLSPRIRHLSFDTDGCGERIEVRCSYLSFRDGVATFDDFISVLSNHLIPFCLPRSEIQEAISNIDPNDFVKSGIAMSQLSEKARGLFIKARKGSHRSGEGGEIVLYILNEWQLGAPQVVSKMYLKTNRNMPVYGSDGIHAKYDDTSKKLWIYWGESKAYATLHGALDAALASISKFRIENGEDREIAIVSDHLDADSWNAESREALLAYLDPYNEQSNNRIPAYSCVLVFSFDYTLGGGTPAAEIEKKFIDHVKTEIANFIADIPKKIEAQKLIDQRFEFFLVPVPNVQEFRDKFQEKIGWPND